LAISWRKPLKSLDWEVLTRAVAWLDSGYKVHLFTVVQTWGSAPRLPGALLAVREDGHLLGSVSGGCVEDDLADKAAISNCRRCHQSSSMESAAAMHSALAFHVAGVYRYSLNL
jgi:xanthine dehydrogenase accessory factor